MVRFSCKELGNRDGPIVVMVSGFPDDETSSWGPEFLDAMAVKYHLYCVCFPGYESPPLTIPSWGYNFYELVDGLHETIVELLGEKTQYHMLGFDFGSILTQIYENKYGDRILKVILLDVGQGLDFNILNYARIFYYQWWFAVSYIISQIFGFTIGNIVFLSFSLFCPPFLSVTDVDDNHRNVKEITVLMCYSYFYLWRAIFTCKPKPKMLTHPTLFIYGSIKNAMFHSQNFLKNLWTNEGCRSIGILGGHYVTYFQPQQCFEEISKFL